MKTIFELNNLEYDIAVMQKTNGRFNVVYGLQVKMDLDYVQAAHELGECIFHALSCGDKLDNENEAER